MAPAKTTPASARLEISHGDSGVLRAVLRARLRDLGRMDQAAAPELEEVELITGLLRRMGNETPGLVVAPIEVRVALRCLDLLPCGPGGPPGLPAPGARNRLQLTLHGPGAANGLLQRLVRGVGALALGWSGPGNG